MKPNNFDALRFWAALLVLWSHTFEQTHPPDGLDVHAREPLFALSHGQVILGDLSVLVFFVISGYLITKSYDRGQDARRFLLARILRIMPALVCVVLLTAFVLGPIVSELSVREYFSTAAPLKYVLFQSTFTHWTDALPGVFASNPETYVNGALWTLRHEVECYALIFLLGVSGMLKKHALLVVYITMFAILGLSEWAGSGDGPVLGCNKWHWDLMVKFLAGALIYQWRIPLRAWAALLAAAVGVACVFVGGFGVAERIVLPYAVMWLALEMPLHIPSPRRWGDWSYGTYVYAWPVAQVVVLCLARPAWWVVGLIATPITLGFAAASWHLVEKRAMAFKGKPWRREGERGNVALEVGPT